jgi:NAD(P)-dependent dehydrogenase (short-subunit alcohol dehydrogenase family)
MGRRLMDKVCIITGSGGSMGRAAALGFAQEGGLIVGCDMQDESQSESQRMVTEAGGRMISHAACDLSEYESCVSLVELAVRTFGQIDVVYNNAAGGRFNWVDKMTPGEWRATMREELDLVYFLCRAAWPYLKARGGSIINTASTSGKIGQRALPQIAHATAKAGIIGFTKQLAVEGGPFGIRANSISPGLIETNKTAALIEDAEWRKIMLDKIILNRPGRPEEVAMTALFLASDESSFITGADISVDGGTTAW